MAQWIFSILLYIVLLLIFLCSCVLLYIKWCYNYWKRKGIPYLKPTLPIGNIGSIFLAQDSIGSKTAKIYNELKKQGHSYGGYFIINRPVFIPIDPELVKSILVRDFQYFDERGAHYDEKVDPLSGHLFSVKNPKWNKLRMKFTPLFTQVKIKNMFPTMVACTRELKNVLEVPSKTGEPIDIKEILARFTTDIISSCALGLECNSLKNPDAELRKTGESFFKATFRNSLVFTCALIAPIILKVLKVPICDPKAANYFLEAIRYNLETREKHNIERNDMFDLLIKLKNRKDLDFPIDFTEIAAQSFIFFLGGFETSSSTMCFTLYEIIKNQSIQEKLRKEILETLQKYNGEISYEAVMEMTYLEQVVRETLRKYPVLPLLNRECTKDYRIPGTDVVIEKGTAVVVSNLGMQRDPDLFEDPDVFDPERFSKERKELILDNSYMPFGLGPRNCIGLRFGALQVKIGLIALLKDYKFSFDPKMKLPPELSTKTLVMAFKDNVWLQAEKV